MEPKIKVIAVVGPTASGKTDLAVEIARRVGGEVISADSRQIYTGLNLGTGKATRREMCRVPHHLLDVASPKRTVSVVQYERLAARAIRDILKRNKIPILCGGTGLYIDAILTNTSFPAVKPNASLRRELTKFSTEELFKKLHTLDPNRAANIDARNPHRLIRAIEVATTLGKVPARAIAQPRYDALIIGLTLPREELGGRIHARLLARMRRGMIAEVTQLHAEGLSWKRMEALGLEYRFLARFLQGKLSKEEMLCSLETAIRQYAKRQMVWFKRNKDIKWFRPGDSSKILVTVDKFLSTKNPD
ncbi:MAG: tRNA (adenosine(37)-N6)-dimethylallyltransferase MiaA [Minisyncoccota bacterium]